MEHSSQPGHSTQRTAIAQRCTAKIRPLNAADSISDLTALIHRAYAQLAAMGLRHTAVDQSPEVTARRIHGGTCFVATLADKIVGTIVVHPTYAENACAYFTRAGVAAAHQLAIEPAYQGLGIGRALLHKAEDWAAHNGFRELALDAAERATHLVDLYTRLGYRPVGWVQWPGKDFRCIVLSKTLPTPRGDTRC